ncbi:MAG: valine--tRNA ligase [Candidatus Omnitrophica bacterium]|nr:valine--tRNA ligase [Candidatus Omnitrophota bacterium]
MSDPRPKELPKAYDPASVEKKWLERWEADGVFHADPAGTGPVFSMVIPPPNVTGILHMGHALNDTLQDIIARSKRMQGYRVLWMPGTDHAGIATQNVVEKSLAKEKIRREDLGRVAFVERVWKWRDEYGGTIVEQLRRLGCSCDWKRLRFTMDEGLSRAVREVFVRLFDRGLVYRSHYIVNWCPRCETALADEEVNHRDLDGAFYHIVYAVEGSEEKLVIATTRPETLLGDTGVGVHPEDERYRHLVGKHAILPILGRKLLIIGDPAIDPAFGTGALKITPAHDPVDFELGRKHHLPSVNIMEKNGNLNAEAGPYRGLSRFEARKRVVERLQADGLLVKTEPHRHAVGHCYRCDEVVEPRASEQWFVKMKPLAEPAIRAVESGEVRFFPNRWTKVYMEWMTNIRDWCISRQIWWGHRIPVYTASDGRYTAAHDEADARRRLGLEESAPLRQDEDVLDTWFSSWLWPFSTMGWPDASPELEAFYPTKTLVTGYEIIFFWVARMMMAGCEFMKQPPFSDIYIHGIVRDPTGAKMSKSKGNVIDPLSVIDRFGADGLRFGIISITSEGQDVYASEDRLEIGRNFANKIWNASRFAMMNLPPNLPEEMPPAPGPHERWILSRLEDAVQKTTSLLDAYHFNEAAGRLYDFFWGEFCDWYIELAKPQITRTDVAGTLRTVLETALKLLHPFMPFLTDEIHSILTGSQRSLDCAAWPRSLPGRRDEALENRVSRFLIEPVGAVRNKRAVHRIGAKETVQVSVSVTTDGVAEAFGEFSADLERLARARVACIQKGLPRPPKSVLALVTPEAELFVHLPESMDLEQERERLAAEAAQIQKYLHSVQAKLKNEKFINNAPEAVVREERRKAEESRVKLERLNENLRSLA